MEGERVKHLRAKFQGNTKEFLEMSGRPGSHLEASLAEGEIPGSKQDQATKLPRTWRLALKNAPLSQDDVTGSGPLCEAAAWVANSKDRNVMESNLHPAFLQPGKRNAPCQQKDTSSNSNLPQICQTQQTWALIKQGVSPGAMLVPAKGSDVPSLLDSPRSMSEKRHTKIPKKKPLPHARTLGLKPMKPQRPPVVDLERFRKAAAIRAHPVPEPMREMQHDPLLQPTARPEQTQYLRRREPKTVSKEDKSEHNDQGHLKSTSAVASPGHLSTPAAPPRVPSSTGDVLSCDQEQIYDDVEVATGKGKGFLLAPAAWFPASPCSGVDARSELPPEKSSSPPTELRKSQTSELRRGRVQNLKQLKKEEQADKEFRRKFKFAGEIHTLTRMMVDPNAAEKKGGGKNLPLKRGEILDVIQLTSPERILCRNSQRTYGYVPRAVLLQLDTDIYDDIDFCD